MKFKTQYGELLKIDDYTTTQSPMEIQYNSIVSVITVIIYSFSIVFALIVVIMVCNKNIYSRAKRYWYF